MLFAQSFPINSAAASTSVQVLLFDRGRADRASAIAKDSSGNIYVAGFVEDASKPSSFAVLKYSPQGSLLWVASYNGAQGGEGGQALALDLDSSGNVYVAGYVSRPIDFLTYDIDWLVASFSPGGSQRWAHRFTESGRSGEQATQLAADPFGNIYASGTAGSDWMTVKYAADGTVIWERRQKRPDTFNGNLVDIKLDADGRPVIMGFTVNGTLTGPKDITTVKYDTEGNKLWEANFTETPESDETPAGMDIDPVGNVYVTGETVATTSPEQAHIPITLKYDGDGKLLFVLRGDGAGGSAVAADALGNIVVTGTAIGVADVFTFFTAAAKYDGFGNRIWLTPIPAPTAVEIDSAGNVYLAGTVGNPGSSNLSDYLAIKLDPNGAKIWEHRFNGRGNHRDIVADMCLDDAGNLLVTGTSPGSFVSFSDDIATLKFPKDFTGNPSPAPAPLAAPTDLSASPASRQASLQWQDNSGDEGGFKVERCRGAGCSNFSQVAQVGPNVTSFIDTRLARNTVYRYRVRAFRGSENSAFSNIVTVTTLRR
jgi:hypothetical protein